MLVLTLGFLKLYGKNNLYYKLLLYNFFVHLYTNFFSDIMRTPNNGNSQGVLCFLPERIMYKWGTILKMEIKKVEKMRKRKEWTRTIQDSGVEGRSRKTRDKRQEFYLQLWLWVLLWFFGGVFGFILTRFKVYERRRHLRGS